jgi:flagellar basal-body rod protein FlgG
MRKPGSNKESELLEGLYSAAAGMAAQQQRMDALSNDVANVNTNGYRRLRLGFRDLVYQQAGGGAAGGVRTGSGSAAQIVGRSFQQGAVRETGNKFDLAIEGQGFFQIRRADGTLALSRDGNFHLDADRRLRDASGGLVEPGVRIPAGVKLDEVSISPDGRVTAAGRAMGRIELVNVAAPDRLIAAGDNYLLVTQESGPAQPAGGARLLPGMLEASNVDLADAMVDMMDAQRSYSMASKAIHMQDRMMEIANQIKQ